ncbi:ferredoxin, 2Fe-2S type, ISC system [Methyloversatilis sp. RAC08]|mgnify:CR=1 FL=1|uniref:ISC system 2Fe-2S type ferredoxin n=1 Tax=Methyloversatilis sp. RAC08 TaxID=1842540 RepID=UPI00083D34BD|nr:ISC system 2Fe-2S type ferredoxin [Methyloversatilis sp. RAC08]AOF82246.1 ferredoxin, 2Fe-2S type, ISC system [Methyloversatilis sp. RAC08]
MSRITVLPHPQLCPTGTSFDAAAGTTVCDALLAHDIAIEHACEKVAACATCHIYVRQGGSSVNVPDDDEEDQLDDAWGLEAASRLACCVRLGNADLTIELPMHTRNLARE